MLSFLRRVFRRDFGPPPRPDEIDQPSFHGERVVETIYSNSRRQRVFITVDESGNYRVYSQRWDTSDWERGYGARWSHVRNNGGHTDTIARAQKLAHEALENSRQDA